MLAYAFYAMILPRFWKQTLDNQTKYVIWVSDQMFYLLL